MMPMVNCLEILPLKTKNGRNNSALKNLSYKNKYFEFRIFIMNYFISLLISLPVSVLVLALVSMFILKPMTIEYCRDQYVAIVKNNIESEIKKFTVRLFVKFTLYGLVAGIVLACLLNFLNVAGYFMRFVLPLAGSVSTAILVAFIYKKSYCIKHYGKIIAFVEMVTSMADCKSSLEDRFQKNETTSSTATPVSSSSGDSFYGSMYLLELEDALVKEIKWTTFLYRALSSAAGYLIGFVVLGLTSIVILQIIAGVIFGAACLYSMNLFLTSHIIEKFGYASLYYQIHDDASILEDFSGDLSLADKKTPEVSSEASSAVHEIVNVTENKADSGTYEVSSGNSENSAFPEKTQVFYDFINKLLELKSKEDIEKLQVAYFNTTSLAYLSAMVPMVSEFENLEDFKAKLNELKS